MRELEKNCIHFLELQKQHHAATFEIEECIAWLEKQKSVDTPTYKIGDFVHCTTVNGFEYTYIYERNHGEVIHAFANYSHATSGVLSIDDTLFEPSISTKRKATHEEICTLLQSISKHGYEWDVEKKELKKIEQKPIEWTDEDEIILKDLLRWLSGDYFTIGEDAAKTREMFKDWFKQLKERMK